MSEKPFNFHERLGSQELETIKREILTALTEYGVTDAKFVPKPDGTSFRITASLLTDMSFIRALQHIAVQYDDNIVFEVENRTGLIIEVTDLAEDTKPTIN
jgi:hypothetical protein